MISIPLQPNRRQLQPWRQCILASYALFFACVLPFLCWGAAGTPGHPHKHAHFVFTASDLQDEAAATQSHVHFPEFVDGEWVFAQPHHHPEDGSRPPLRSEPDLPLITILLVLLSALATIAYTPLSLFLRKLAHSFPDPLIHTPPSPPPKLPTSIL